VRLGRTLRTRGDEQVVAAAQARADVGRRAHTLRGQDVPVSIGVPPQLEVSRHFSRRVSTTRFTPLVKQGTVWYTRARVNLKMRCDRAAVGVGPVKAAMGKTGLVDEQPPAGGCQRVNRGASSSR
jgi:hypothetical protein